MDSTISKTDNPSRYNPYTYILVSFSDSYLEFKDFYFVAHQSFLSKIDNSCREVRNYNHNYVNNVYNETINLAYRPKVRIEDFCISAIKYICCKINISDLLNEYRDQAFIIIINVNIDKEELSSTSITDPSVFYKNIGFFGSFNLLEESELSMSLLSKVNFLREDERKFLSGLIKIVNNLKQSKCRLTYDELWDLLFEHEDIRMYDHPQIDRCVKSLVFYEFITFQPEFTYREDGLFDKYYQNITICDLKLINENLDAVYIRLSEPVENGILTSYSPL
jgi:hypothetical protein